MPCVAGLNGPRRHGGTEINVRKGLCASVARGCRSGLWELGKGLDFGIWDLIC